jgi:purine-binding chemotaxis protein CheW
MASEIKSETTAVQYLSFVIDKKLFGFDVLKTREVLLFTDVTPIPGAPSYIRGVLNLRGSVVPVIDVRRKFAMADAAFTENTAVIIIEVTNKNETSIAGVLVDEVRGVLNFDSAEIEPPPKMGGTLSTEVINGIAKFHDQFVMIIDTDTAFSEDAISPTDGNDIFEKNSDDVKNRNFNMEKL